MVEFLDKVQGVLNITDSNGQVITLIGDRLTVGQLLLILMVVTTVMAMVKFFRGIFRVSIIAATLVGASVYFGVISPQELQDVSDKIAEQGVKTYESVVSMSDNIKIEGSSIHVNLGGVWHNVEEVTSFVKGSDGSATIKLGDQSFTTDDVVIIQLLKMLK